MLTWSISGHSSSRAPANTAEAITAPISVMASTTSAGVLLTKEPGIGQRAQLLGHHPFLDHAFLSVIYKHSCASDSPYFPYLF